MTLHELIDLIDNGEMDPASRIGPRIDEEIAAVVREQRRRLPLFAAGSRQ